MSQSNLPADVWELFDAACDGQISEADVERLQSLLDSPEHRQLYVDYCRMHADLHFRVRADRANHRGLTVAMDAAVASAPAPVPMLDESIILAAASQPSNWFGPSWRSVAFFCLGCLLSVAVLGWWQSFSAPRRDQVATTQASPIAEAVAYLTVDNGVVWGGNRPAIRSVGSTVQLGDEIVLTEGIAEFRLASGVALGIEGPASLFLISPSKLVLQYGKLTAHVPWRSEDFNVVTPGCQMIVRDAEFGVSLKGNKLDIHTFSGEVAAASAIVSGKASGDGDDEPVADANDFRDAVVAAGRALQLTSSGEFLQVAGWKKAEPADFAAKLSMSGPLPITPDYVELVKSAQPISYWRFEQIANQKIPNEVKSGPPLKAIDKSSLVGDEENRSAELRADGDWFVRTVSRLPLVGTDYSLELWVKPSHLHQGRIVGFDCKDSKNRASASIELQGGIQDSFGKEHLGAVRYVHRGDKGGYVSCFSSRAYAVRRWQHVVAVKSGSHMKLYLDGALSESREASSALPNDAFIVVGVHQNNRRDFKFIGQIDELAVYDRALSDEEIRQHYEAVDRAAKEPQPVEKVKQLNETPKKARVGGNAKRREV
jgi:hypothetical protein